MSARFLERLQNSHTLLELLETLKGDFKLIWRVERGRVVLDLDAEERNDRHIDGLSELSCLLDKGGMG